jgi:hypothetical protein
VICTILSSVISTAVRSNAGSCATVAWAFFERAASFEGS